MSSSKGVRFDGSDDEWNEYASILKKNGKSIQEDITSKIRQELSLSKNEEDKLIVTASGYQDRLRDKLLETDLSKVIMQGKYHVIINDIGFVQAARHDLTMRVRDAVRGAVYKYWIKIWDEKLGWNEVKMSVRDLSRFNESINKIKVTYTVNTPTITLSDLRESHIGNVIQFDCLIVGPTPKMLDSDTGKYIQYVLIQEPETTAKNNNPTMIKAILHGDDTNDIASGMRKRMLGIYTVEPPKEGLKAKKDKTLIVDAISVQDLEDKTEITLEPYEIEATKEMAYNHQEQYIKGLIDSFCPKILGRELEKKALYLSLLGGSDIEGYRKESHLMLVGEADTGKSEMVKFANKIAHKSSIIDGANATGVGILFALDEYDGLKILRQGAMILNDGGHLIVDEYDKMDKKEQKKLNQSMEQQWASYNKGGHKGEAQCKTTVIASCNPEAERWNEEKSLIDNLPFDASTISRFDLMIRLRHQNHENQIRAKMLHIARRKRGESDHVSTPEWLAGLLNYQRKLRPVFNAESEELLINRFVEFTQIEQDNGSLQIQTRQMEGIQRLCEAWAKMLFKEVIDCEIVEDVIKFYQECMATLGMNVEKGITQFDLRGHSTNKDSYFQDVFRVLSSKDEQGHVSITDLAEELQHNTAMFNSDQSVASYVEKRKQSGWLFEPKLGELKRQ
jgi:replicative DNA helicase Mcm